MEFFYDGQIRRYITQTIRVFSNFVVRYGDGTLHRIPVMYGDADRQVASIIRGNSENKVNSVPRISVYVSAFALDRDRLADASYVGKVNVRERGMQVDNVPGSPTYGETIYNQDAGRQYTVERIMPTPFKLTLKVDIWSANTEQKLQIMEQILVLFNPSLELQTTDSYIDWTSLTVLNLNDINWSSKTVPVGVDTPIEVGTLTLDTPVWISPPAKVKHLGVITRIITSMYQSANVSDSSYIEGLGTDPIGSTVSLSKAVSNVVSTITDYKIQVYGNNVTLLGPHESVVPMEPTIEISLRQGDPISWLDVFSSHLGKYVAGSSMIYLTQPNGSSIIGTIAVNPIDPNILTVNWNPDTLSSNTGIDSNGILEGSSKIIAGIGLVEYNASASYRPNSPGTFDAIIDPQTYDPKRPHKEYDAQPVAPGTRFLIIEDLGSEENPPGTGPTAWQSSGGDDFVAKTNDIIEWSGTEWKVIFNASQESTTLVWQTNIYTGVQYLWNGVSWVKSYEGEYTKGQWMIVL